MRLKKGVFFRCFEDRVYVKNIPAQCEFFFNETGGEILTYLKQHPDAARADVTAYMCALYEDDSVAGDIEEFLDQLDAMGLTEGGAPSEERDAVSDEMFRWTMEHDLLWSVSLELTYRCCERCIHCYIDDGNSPAYRDELTLAEYKDLLDQLRELGCMKLLLTGGEVCLHRDFLDIARYAVEKGFLVDIYTTGVPMTDEMFDALCELPLNSVSFSIYGSTPERHDAVTLVPGSFQKTMNRMMMFKCAGVPTYIKTVLIQQTWDDYANILKLGRRLGIEVQTSSIIAPTHTGCVPAGLRLNDVEKYTRCRLLNAENDTPVRQGAVRDLKDPACGCGRNMLSFTPTGDIQPCISMPMVLGNVRTHRVRDIWEHSEQLRQIQNIRFCDLKCSVATCEYRDYCFVCLGSAYAETGELGKPTPECCMLAEAGLATYRALHPEKRE